MDEQHQLMRRQFSNLGWTLLAYYGIMNAAVMAVLVLQGVILTVQSVISGTAPDIEATMEALLTNGWGYFLAIGIGFLILLLWKKPEFCFHTLWTTEKPMRAGDFLCLLSLTVGAQLVFQLLAWLQETILNCFGLSILTAMESAAGIPQSLSMFLYSGFGAPIAEEILFRGLILRSMQPYGKRFAILGSAILFGLFHGNLVQSPYAFAIGLILGYVTVEHSILWAMVLHMFNNLILADALSRLAQLLPQGVGDGVILTGIILCGIAAVVILIVRRKEVLGYLRAEEPDRQRERAFVSAPGILVLAGVMLASALLPLAMQLITNLSILMT